MHWLERWVLPPECVLTGEKTRDRDISDEITASWKRPERVCPQCCEPSPDANICGACLTQPPAFDRTQVGFYFGEELSDLIHGLKYGNQIAYSRLLGELLAKKLDTHGIQAIAAVPLHQQRWRERGFNQSQLLAETLSRELEIPLISNALFRVKDTPSQTGLNAKQRQTNLKQAFDIDASSFAGIESIALVDDVITTGSTMQALANLLKNKTQVKQVEAWAVAKTE